MGKYRHDEEQEEEIAEQTDPAWRKRALPMAIQRERAVTKLCPATCKTPVLKGQPHKIPQVHRSRTVPIRMQFTCVSVGTIPNGSR